jgi:hypothetical protein
MRQRQWIRLVAACAVIGAGSLVAASLAAAQLNVVGQWTPLNAMPYVPVHVHTLPTGRAMIWGGVEVAGGAGDTGDDPRSWDPATQSVTTLGKAGFNLLCAGHAYLADGSLFVAGGHVSSSVGLKQAAKYQPFSNTWTAVPPMNDARWYPTVTTLPNGDALVVGGDIDLTQGVNPLAQVYQVATGTWRNLTTAQLILPWYPRLFVAPNGTVFNAGPESASRYLHTSGTGAWSAGPLMIGGERFYGSAVLYGPGKILTMGGGDPHGASPPTNSAEVIDLNQPAPGWRAVGSMQFGRRQLNAVLLPDGKVLAVGGTSGPGFNDSTSPVHEAELWDPATETWSVMARASAPRLYHSSALLLPDGRVLTTGGNGYTAAEAYEPPYLFKGVRPVITTAPSRVPHGFAFSVTTPNAANIRRVTMVRLPSTTHGFDENQRFNELSFVTAPGALTVRAPASAADAPPGHYMLFILDGNDVPSVAKIFQLGGSPNPLPSTFLLSVTRRGPGTVTSVPPGIACGTDCSEVYGAGTTVTLTATPNGNKAHFVGWSGACSGTGTCSVTLHAATSVVATFVRK